MINLDRDEIVVKKVHKHWFIFLMQFLKIGALYLLPIVFYALAHYFASFSLPDAYLNFLILSWTAVIWAKFLGVFTDYYLDMWVLTDKRVITIDQRGFWSRVVGSLRLERIQDVSTEVAGVMETLLDFGSIRVETAGDEEDFIIHGIPHPKHFKEVILAQVDAKLERGGRELGV